ncbi:hypothetical protein sos41_33030 [Alphaproteobacteria bacterium SO-S41]|nr:hypothetical protein sos41_33030 [Alphaproteobacteria bacterium SO-S41]
MLRRATTDDIPIVAAGFLAARKVMLDIVPMVHPDESVLPWMRDVLFPTTEMWVAEVQGRVAAMMSLSAGWVEHLYADPSAQGGGVGTALLDLAKANAHGAGGLQLWTFQGNAGARRFYERRGFIAVAFTDGAGNEERTPDVRYVWHHAHSR